MHTRHHNTIHTLLCDFYHSDLLPGSSLSLSERVQKSAMSETTAQQLALCNSFYVTHIYNLIHHTRLVGGQRLVTVLKTPFCILVLLHTIVYKFQSERVGAHAPPALPLPTGLSIPKCFSMVTVVPSSSH